MEGQAERSPRETARPRSGEHEPAMPFAEWRAVRCGRYNACRESKRASGRSRACGEPDAKRRRADRFERRSGARAAPERSDAGAQRRAAMREEARGVENLPNRGASDGTLVASDAMIERGRMEDVAKGGARSAAAACRPKDGEPTRRGWRAVAGKEGAASARGRRVSAEPDARRAGRGEAGWR